MSFKQGISLPSTSLCYLVIPPKTTPENLPFWWCQRIQPSWIAGVGVVTASYFPVCPPDFSFGLFYTLTLLARSLTLKWRFTSKILKQRKVIGVYVHQWKLPIWKGRRLLLQACITRQSFHQGTSSLHYSNYFPVFTPTWTEETESLEESSLIQEKLLEITLGPYGYFLYIVAHVDVFSFLGERICTIFIKVWKYHKQ